MGVRILWDSEQDTAALFCSTTGGAFGPVFEGPAANVEAGEFLDWLRENPPHWAVAIPAGGDGTDPRDYRATELERIVRFWRETARGETDG
jgi:hypothetical protein